MEDPGERFEVHISIGSHSQRLLGGFRSVGTEEKEGRISLLSIQRI